MKKINRYHRRNRVNSEFVSSAFTERVLIDMDRPIEIHTNIKGPRALLVWIGLAPILIRQPRYNKLKRFFF